MNYEEFSNLIPLQTETSKYMRGFAFPTGEDFYIEPTFYTQLVNFKSIQPENFEKVLNSLLNLAKTRKHVVFCGDFENPYIELDGYKYLEFTDVTDPIQVYFEDKSRGSDYGD